MSELTTGIISAIVGAAVGSLGTWFIQRKDKNHDLSMVHLNKIKNEVLEPFLDKLDLDDELEKPLPYISENHMIIKSRYDSINQELLNDAFENHFSQLNVINSKLNKIKERINNRIDKALNGLIKKFGDRGFYKESLERFFILGQDTYVNVNLHIDYDHLMHGQRIICNSDEKTSIEIKAGLEKLYTGNIGKDIKGLHHELSKVKHDFRKELERALASEKLKGECDFLK